MTRWIVDQRGGDPCRRAVATDGPGRDGVLPDLIGWTVSPADSPATHTDADREEMEANARLFAAAPELAELAEAFVRVFDNESCQPDSMLGRFKAVLGRL